MNFLHIFVFMLAHESFIEGYTTFSMKDLNSCSKPVEISLSSMRHNSTGILVYALDGSYEPSLHCEVILRPPLAYGVVTSIRAIDLQPSVINYADCENYIEISKIGHHNSAAVRICGYSDDVYEFQSYIHWGRTNIVFHTSNTSKVNKATFQLTFTSIRKGNNWCFEGERRCHNGHCIWKGLSCDGHNNCGDVSDELDKFTAQCGNLSTGESLAVILITIVGSLFLLIIAAYLRGPKITQQIERLSASRSNESAPARSMNNENRTVDTINRRNNYGSTSPEMYQTAAYDPPPSYEEVLGLPVNLIPSAVSAERPSIGGNIPSVERPSTSENNSSFQRPFTNTNISSAVRPFTSGNTSSAVGPFTSGNTTSNQRPLTSRNISMARPSTRRNTVSVEQGRPSINTDNGLNEHPVTSIYRTQSFQS